MLQGLIQMRLLWTQVVDVLVCDPLLMAELPRALHSLAERHHALGVDLGPVHFAVLA